jgi:hypothetical protein
MWTPKLNAIYSSKTAKGKLNKVFRRVYMLVLTEKLCGRGNLQCAARTRVCVCVFVCVCARARARSWCVRWWMRALKSCNKYLLLKRKANTRISGSPVTSRPLTHITVRNMFVPGYLPDLWYVEYFYQERFGCLLLARVRGRSNL